MLRFRDWNHIDASINLVLMRSAHVILRRACPTWGARLEGLRASRRTATSETEPAAILRDGALRLLKDEVCGDLLALAVAGGGILPAAIRRLHQLFDRLRQLSRGELAGRAFEMVHHG